MDLEDHCTMPRPASPAATLVGRFLVAAPSMPDERFQKSVVFICKHDDDGALGHHRQQQGRGPAAGPGLQATRHRGARHDRPSARSCSAGRSRPRAVWCCTRPTTQRDETLLIEGGLALTASVEILKDMAGGSGPQQAWLALGHSGWAPGQLDREMQDNAWLVVDGDADAGVRSRPRRQVAARPRPPQRRLGRPVRSGVVLASDRPRLRGRLARWRLRRPSPGDLAACCRTTWIPDDLTQGVTIAAQGGRNRPRQMCKYDHRL